MFRKTSSPSPVTSGPASSSATPTAIEARLCRPMKPPTPAETALTLETVALMSLTCIHASFPLLTHAGIRGAGRLQWG